MITWDKNITEPPPTKSISIEDLKMIGNGDKKLSDFIPKVMSHSIGKKTCPKNLIICSRSISLTPDWYDK